MSLVIVAHSEERHIGAKLRNCLDLDYPRDRLEILVVSDGSTDRTDEIVEGFVSRGVGLLKVPGPRGKPIALNQAVPQTRGEILVLCDARQRLDAAAVRRLVATWTIPRWGR